MIIIKNILWDVEQENKEVLASLPTQIKVQSGQVNPAVYGVRATANIQEIKENQAFMDALSDFISENYEFTHKGFEIELPSEQTYHVYVHDTTGYAIKAASAEEARDIAWNYFLARPERHPIFNIQIDDDCDPDIEL